MNEPFKYFELLEHSHTGLHVIRWTSFILVCNSLKVVVPLFNAHVSITRRNFVGVPARCDTPGGKLFDHHTDEEVHE